jgi:hypothetical protein
LLNKLATGTYLDVFYFEGAEQSERDSAKIKTFLDFNPVQIAVLPLFANR